jgi:NADPH:quinone reductase
MRRRSIPRISPFVPEGGQRSWPTSLVADGGGLVTLKGWTGPSERGIVIHPVSSFGSATNTALFDQLRSQAESGILTLRVADVVPATMAAEAHRRLTAGGIRGRLVLDFSHL